MPYVSFIKCSERQGYIKLHQDLINNPALRTKSQYITLIQLLHLALDKEEVYRGITVKPGEFIVNYEYLANKINCSLSTVKRSLNRLRSEGLIMKESTKQYTKITVLDWESYNLNN